MNNETRENSMQGKVLDLIESGRVKMRPKWHFLLMTALAVAGVTILALALVYLVSFILFVLHQTGVWFLPAFGWGAARAFLIKLPWVLILLAAIFLVILEILVERFSFAYRRPLLVTLIGVTALAALGGMIVANTRFHGGLFRHAEQDDLPFAGPLYRSYGTRHFDDIHRGVVSEMFEDGFQMDEGLGESTRVLVTPLTRFGPEARLSQGDPVLVFGLDVSGVIRAIGVRKIDADALPILPFVNPR